MFRKYEGIWVILVALVWFSVLTPWGRFADPDAFYHAHVASLILGGGPLKAFPWLDLTTVGQHYVDAHFLFHLILIPGILIARVIASGPFASFWGAQVTAVILAASTILVVWTSLRRIDPKRAWIWTVLLALVPGFSTRLLLGKASPIAVGLFIALIGLLIVKQDRRTLVRLFTVALIGFLFTLSHGGWIILLLGTGAIVAGELLFERLVNNTPWMTTLRHASWRSARAVVIGIVGGILAHPNRDELLRFLWVQVVKAGFGNNTSVVQGGEWMPALPSFVVYHLATLLIPTIMALWGIVLSWTDGKKSGIASMKQFVLLSMPLAFTLALTLNSRRFLEYLAPVMALWTAALWVLMDEQQLITSTRKVMMTWPRRLQRIVPALALIGVLAVAAHQARDTWSELRREAGRPFDAWRTTMSAISARANPGDRVFADWDEFPTLFAADDRLRYLSGLDPVFLEDADSILSQRVEDVLRGRKPWTAWDVVSKTGSRFVFVTTKRHPIFTEALKSDPRFHELTHDSESAAYEVFDR